MRFKPWLAASLMVVCAAGTAFAFGTVHILGQNAEHERITRKALACGHGLAPDLCFQQFSLSELAGKNGTFGAVGAPDNPTRGLMSADAAHCDNGDYVATPGYPHSQEAAQAKLNSCRQGMVDHINEAVRDSARLLDSKGRIDDSQIPTYVSCTFNGRKGRAKCNVLEDLGLLLHASQDFYSHSNWNDEAAPGPITLTNPAGLNNQGRAGWLNLRSTSRFPPGLITGCYEGFPESLYCRGHVKHEYLNKDKGQIDPTIGKGTTDRGKIGDNFQKAVQAAIEDTRDKISDFRERLAAAYGPSRAALMMCAITNDAPDRNCR